MNNEANVTTAEIKVGDVVTYERGRNTFTCVAIRVCSQICIEIETIKRFGAYKRARVFCVAADQLELVSK